MQFASFADNLNRILKVNVYIRDFSVVYLNHDYNIAKAVIYVNPFLRVYMTFKFYYITDMHQLINVKLMVDYEKHRLIENFISNHGFTQTAKYSATYEKNDKSGFKVIIWNENIFLDYNDQRIATTNLAESYRYNSVPVDTLISIACGDSSKILLRLNNMEIEKTLGGLE